MRAVQCGSQLRQLGVAKGLNQEARGAGHGVALGARGLTVDGRAQAPPGPDFEFVVTPGAPAAFTAIHRPMDLVEVLPSEDCFVDTVDVTLRHPEPDTEIRYTLDGTLPTPRSTLYSQPITLRDTTCVMARAFRRGVAAAPNTMDGTLASAPHWAVYTRERPRQPRPAARTADARPGLRAAYYQGDWTLSPIRLAILDPVQTAVAPRAFDVTLRQGRDQRTTYALAYRGYLEAPRDGLYNFIAPPELVSSVVDAGYDLRVFLGGEEWYPATRRQNYGVWTVPLRQGSYRFEVVWVDQRPGDSQTPKGAPNKVWRGQAPVLEVSGPGITRQPLPAAWLWHAGGPEPSPGTWRQRW